MGRLDDEFKQVYGDGIPKLPNGTRNSKTLGSFIAYCAAHPSERFWQALRNWAGVAFLVAVRRDDSVRFIEARNRGGDIDELLYDTFSWEDRDK